ncbi:MAG: hypothetical protein KC431_04205, partial [Myxococcales bacterium]|nr:hypothetical protein [Myxococcales bacterium]
MVEVEVLHQLHVDAEAAGDGGPAVGRDRGLVGLAALLGHEDGLAVVAHPALRLDAAGQHLAGVEWIEAKQALVGEPVENAVDQAQLVPAPGQAHGRRPCAVAFGHARNPEAGTEVDV